MSIEIISKGLSHASSISTLIPLVLCLFKYKAFNKQLKALFIYISASIITEVVGLFAINFPQIGLPVFYSFTILETTLISYLFFKEMGGKSYKLIIKLGFCCFLISSLISFFVTKSFVLADNFSRPFEFALIVCLSLIFFYKVFIDLNIAKLSYYYFFWFNSAFLIYFGTNFIFFLLLPYVATENTTIVNLLGVFHLVMSITYNILLAIGIWKIKQD